jgi:hypothetical protein
LTKIGRDEPPFASVPRDYLRGSRWAEPRLVAEIDYGSWTTDQVRCALGSCKQDGPLCHDLRDRLRHATGVTPSAHSFRYWCGFLRSSDWSSVGNWRARHIRLARASQIGTTRGTRYPAPSLRRSWEESVDGIRAANIPVCAKSGDLAKIAKPIRLLGCVADHE